MNNWCKKSKIGQYGTKLKFPNSGKELFDWDNEELLSYKGLVEEDE